MRRLTEDQSDWMPVAHESELVVEGDYVLLPWRVDSELALMRQGGELVAFDNRCHHRGARIFDKPSGRTEPRCPYHARLSTAANVNRYDTFTFGGFVFCAGEPYKSRMRIIPTEMDNPFGDFLRGASGMVKQSELRFIMDCHWTVAVENALDHEHVELVHKESLAELLSEPREPVFWNHGWSYHQFNAKKPKALNAVGQAINSTSVADFDYAHTFFFPGACVSSTRGWTYSLQTYFPRVDGRTNFWHRLYAPPSISPAYHHANVMAAIMNAKVFDEDAVVCARVPPNFSGELGPKDARIAEFRKHLRSML